MTATLLRGGRIADPLDGEYDADVLLAGGRILAIGDAATGSGAEHVVDVSGRILMPGFVDAHSHADARVLDEDMQLSLLRQGVTTVIGGQDGVSFAPGDGAYASDYFGAINGSHPFYTGGGVGALLAGYDGRTRLNVGYLVPAGTVRHLVMGTSSDAPTADQLRRMQSLVAEGIADGALGLSTGLDYSPGCFSDAAEISALCAPVADAGALYVTHMRGYEENSRVGTTEVAEICSRAGVRAHISHFHAHSRIIAELMEELHEQGHDVSFDAYPYFRGSTILAAIALPPDLASQPAERVVEALSDPVQRARIRREWIEPRERRIGTAWPRAVHIASVESAQWQWTEGLTLEDAAARTTGDAVDLCFELLHASRLRASVVMDVPNPRDDDDLRLQFGVRGATCGSDGIPFGRFRHPRAAGAFARMLEVLVRDTGEFSWSDAATILSGRASERFGLGGRGRIAAGAVADLAVVDPATVGARSRYDAPLELAVGIDDVFVAGRAVLADGRLTDNVPGRALRRGQMS